MLLLLFACSSLLGRPTPDVSSAASPGEPGRTDISGTTATTDSEGVTDTEEPPLPVKPCFTYETPVQTGTVVDATLEELSDIVPSRKNPGVLWVHEDSGNPSVVTALNSSGETLGSFKIDGAEMVDWEDMAMGECGDDWCLWIGDIGDNQVNRSTVRLIEVVEPDLSTESSPFSLTLSARGVYDVPYPDADHNAEALIWSESGPMILTKTNTTTDVYAVDLANLGMTHLGTLSTSGILTTAADLWPDGSRLLVRTYTSLDEFWLSAGGLSDLIHTVRVSVPTGVEKQGEAASYDPVLRGYWTVSEGVNPTLFWAGCSSEPPDLQFYSTVPHLITKVADHQIRTCAPD